MPIDFYQQGCAPGSARVAAARASRPSRPSTTRSREHSIQTFAQLAFVQCPALILVPGGEPFSKSILQLFTRRYAVLVGIKCRKKCRPHKPAGSGAALT